MLSNGHTPESADRMVVERVLRNGKRVRAHRFKLWLVHRCLEPGVSVAGLALEHGVNANLLRAWTTKHRDEVCDASPPVRCR